MFNIGKIKVYFKTKQKSNGEEMEKCKISEYKKPRKIDMQEE